MKTLCALVLLALASAPALAGIDNPMTPGLWEVSVQVRMTGMPYQMPPHTARQCITAAMLKENGGVPKPHSPPGTQCKMINMHRSGNRMDWGMSCSGQTAMQGEGSMIWDSATSYHGQMHMTMDMAGHHTDMKQTMQGKRLGDCTK